MSDEQNLEKLASWYTGLGWKILPCHGVTEGGRCTCGGQHSDPKDIGKHPAIYDWPNQATTDPNQISSWWRAESRYNIGVACRDSGFFVIDIDPRSGGFESFLKFEELVNGALPPTVEAITGEYTYKGQILRGRHLFYRCEFKEELVGNLRAAKLPGIDIKHNGYVLLHPSNHISGVSYGWKPGHAPWEIHMADAPDELLDTLRKRGRTASMRSSTSLGSGDWSALDGLEFKGERIDVDKLLEEGLEEGERAVTIYAMSCALANKFPQDELGRQAVENMMIRFNYEKVRPPLELEGPTGLLGHVRRAIDFVHNNPKHSRGWTGISDWEKEAAARIAGGSQNTSALTSRTAPISTSDPDDDVDYSLDGTIGGMVSIGVHNGESIMGASTMGNIDVPRDPDAVNPEDGGIPGQRSLTDVGNGRRIVDNFGQGVRYTPGLGWYTWSGTHWKNDIENLELRELAKRVSVTIASEVIHYDDPNKKQEVMKWAMQTKSNARLNSAIDSCTSDPRVFVPVDEWDSDDHLLGVKNGVVDLRTGELLKGRPDLHITRRSPVAYQPGRVNNRWTDFVDFATGGDKELQDWIQRAVGYTITGLNTQDVMFLVYGPPGSGKNTFVEAIVKCLGTQQYAWPMDSTILAQDNGQSNNTDLYHWAELRGRRMVWVDELPESERIKENAVKKLTGSSEISARSPGEKPFTFQSHAKLWLTTNHRPIITDDAMWRRIRPIPWSQVPTVADPTLKEFLFDPEGGMPAILAWAVEGAIKYLGSKDIDPLGWCTAVHQASDVYRRSEDRIGMFLVEETEETPGLNLAISSMYLRYRMWSESRGERAMTQIALLRKLRDRGIPIEGDGSRAMLMNRGFIPTAAPSHTAGGAFDIAGLSSSVNWAR